MAKKQLAIFFIDVNKAYFYGSNAQSILQVDIPADTISYFDVVNKDKFYEIIKTLITANKIEPAPLLVLFPPAATYEHDPEGKTPEEMMKNTEQFIDVVPYEKVLSKTYKIQEKTKVVAVNKDVYEVVKHGFEKFGFQIVSVASLSLLQKVMPEIGTSLNLEVIGGKFEAIKQYSFITLDQINNPGKTKEEQAESAKKNPLFLYGLIGVFVVLIGILVVMVMTTFKPAPQPVKKRAAAVIVAATPTPMPTIPVVPSVSPTAIPVVKGASVGSAVTPISPKVSVAPVTP